MSEKIKKHLRLFNKYSNWQLVYLQCLTKQESGKLSGSGVDIRDSTATFQTQGKAGMLKRLQSERFLESTKRKNIHQANSVSNSGKNFEKCQKQPHHQHQCCHHFFGDIGHPVCREKFIFIWPSQSPLTYLFPLTPVTPGPRCLPWPHCLHWPQCLPWPNLSSLISLFSLLICFLRFFR